MGHIREDLRVALRRFRHQPAFTAVVVLTLALGLGANTAIFALVDALLLRSLPVERPEELYRLGDTQQLLRQLRACRAATRSISYPARRAPPRPGRRRSSNSRRSRRRSSRSALRLSGSGGAEPGARRSSSPATTSACSACGAAAGRLLRTRRRPARRGAGSGHELSARGRATGSIRRSSAAR